MCSSPARPDSDTCGLQAIAGIRGLLCRGGPERPYLERWCKKKKKEETIHSKFAMSCLH